MMPGTLARYFGFRFLNVVVIVFGGLFLLVLMVDMVEMLRRTTDLKDVPALLVAKISFYRVPFVTERVIPFAVLIGAMTCYLNLSRRLELVVARSAGISAWQFVRPAVVIALLIGIAVTTVYNPVSASLREQSERLEAMLYGNRRDLHTTASGFWLRQRGENGQSIVNAATSSQQGAALSNVTVFTFDNSDLYRGRIEAKRATLHDGYWRLEDARVYSDDAPISDHKVYDLKTNLTRAQVQETFATPENVPFWQLSSYIKLAENQGLAAIGYRLQYYQLLMMPFYLVAMVLLAAAVSLRMFRFGGVQKMALSGIAAGFLLYVLSKVTGDLSRADFMAPVVAAALPPFVGGVTGIVALLYQEDG
jgi:lipopolysaccharide export system permease protein